jgi:hypothetical protein
MQIDNIRIEPWIPTVRRTTLMLMLACFGIGILIGSLTTEKIAVTQDRITTAADPVDPAASSSSAKDGGRPSREPENRPSRASNAQEEASDTATPPAALPSAAQEGGRASREPENRPNRASNAREETSDTAMPPAALPSSAKEGGGASRERENRPSRASNAREETSDAATPPAARLNPGAANEYQARHKRAPRPARMIRWRKLDRPSPDESGERVEGRHPARDYRDLRNQMLNR